MIITECAKLELWDVLQNIFLRNNRLYDVNEPDDDGNTLVHILSVKRRETLLADVIEMGGIVNVQNKKGVSPLHMAVRMGHMPIVQLLINNKANPNIVDISGETPIFSAVRKNSVHVVKYLREHKSKFEIVNNLGNGLLHVAGETNSVHVAKYLIEEELIADVNRKNKSLETCLDVAVKKNHLHIAEYFITIFETVDKLSPLLHTATRNNNIVLTEILIKAGIDPNVQDSAKASPLHLAVELQSLNLVILLVDYFADVNHPDIDGYTPLHVAARSGNKTILKYLICKGADLGVITSGGDKAIHLAAMAGHARCVKVLLKCGQSVETGCCNSAGQSPLHLAASNGHTEVVQILLQEQFDPLLVDRTGSTPVFMAKLRKQEDTYKVLRDSLTTIVV